jgi:hypothetical protein
MRRFQFSFARSGRPTLTLYSIDLGHSCITTDRPTIERLPASEKHRKNRKLQDMTETCISLEHESGE